MTLNELQRWILKTGEEDSWWVAVDGEVQDNVSALPDISKLKQQKTDQQISILHVSRSNDEKAEWIIFEAPKPRQVKLAKSARGQEPSTFKVPKANRPNPSEQAADEPIEAVAAAPDATEQVALFDQADTHADSAEISELRAEVSELSLELKDLKKSLRAFEALADELKSPILEAHKLLEERERFLEVGENALFDKAQKQEVIHTELEQLREELNSRERLLKERASSGS
jgi:chromosome segregation ATPase